MERKEFKKCAQLQQVRTSTSFEDDDDGVHVLSI
jgi:hypothetical protein